MTTVTFINKKKPKMKMKTKTNEKKRNENKVSKKNCRPNKI